MTVIKIPEGGMLYFHPKIDILAYTSEKVCKQKAKDKMMASNFCSYDKSQMYISHDNAQLSMHRRRNHGAEELTIEAECESPFS